MTERYRGQARAAIAALERIRASSEAAISSEHLEVVGSKVANFSKPNAIPDIRPGATVVYRPAGDQRAYPCRVVEIRGSQAYLAPILRTCIGWIAIESPYLPPEDEPSGKQ
ncbi:hypothetical protein AAII07_55080 [Microvirga sp. 0TCS3.31]